MPATWTITLWWNDVPPIDHNEEGQGLLGWQYKSSPRIQSFLDAFLDETQSLEMVCRSMLAQCWPYTAEGVNLDTIGRIVVYERKDGMSDDEYRIFILCKIFANKSDCTAEEIIKLLVLAGLVGQIEYREIYPAEIQVSVTECDYPNTIFEILGFIQPGGVMLDFIYNSNDLADCLTINDTLSVVGSSLTSGLGWSGDPTIGGIMSGVYRS